MKKLKRDAISPERKNIATIFKKHIEEAIKEVGTGYTVTIQGKFDKTPIKIEIEVTGINGIP
jgi:hypothetical protein